VKLSLFAYFCSNLKIPIMSRRSKAIFLGVSIFGSFLIYSVFYYSQMLKKAPYRSYELESIVFKYGQGDDLVNHFDSRTQTYTYVNRADVLVSDTVRLNKDDLIYIHHKAAALGFWNFPDDMTQTNNPADAQTSTRFYLEFNYKEKSKKLLLDVNYNGNPKLLQSAKSLVEEVQRLLNDASDR